MCTNVAPAQEMVLMYLFLFLITSSNKIQWLLYYILDTNVNQVRVTSYSPLHSVMDDITIATSPEVLVETEHRHITSLMMVCSIDKSLMVNNLEF